MLAAQDAWKQALIKKDRAGFDKVLHKDLRYGHFDGHIEDKATAIKMIVEGLATWEAVNFADTSVAVRGSTAFVTGKVQYLEREKGQLAEINLVVLSSGCDGLTLDLDAMWAKVDELETGAS